MSPFCVGFVSHLRNLGWNEFRVLDFWSMIWRMNQRSGRRERQAAIQPISYNFSEQLQFIKDTDR
jgi:hypothetical protein